MIYSKIFLIFQKVDQRRKPHICKHSIDIIFKQGMSRCLSSFTQFEVIRKVWAPRRVRVPRTITTIFFLSI